MSDVPVSLDQLIATVRSRTAGGDALQHLTDAVLLGNYVSEQADNLIGHFVDQARRSGASWSQIGAAMGVSKQAAQQRWVPRFTDLLSGARGFTRFTDRARNVLAYANRLAGASGAAAIGPEHLLLALHFEPEGVAAKMLDQLGLDKSTLAAALKVDVNLAAEVSRLGCDDNAMNVLDATLHEALRLGHNYIGTEHILLGALATDSELGRTLAGLGATTATVEPLVRDALARL